MIANGISSGLWTTLRRSLYFGLSLFLVLIAARYSRAADTAGASSNQSSSLDLITILFVVVGIILTVLYIRGMYLVLSYASKTYGLQDTHTAIPESRKTNNLLILGSALLVIGSAIIISIYGLGPAFLYIGPTLSLLGPLVIIISMEVDLKRYRRQLSAHHLEQQTGFSPPDASVDPQDIETRLKR